MYQIRHYSQLIHPDHFREGLLGLTIRGLNWVRWKLEVFNQRLVVRYLLKESAVDKVKQKTIRERFEIDVAAERVEKRLTSPSMEGVDPIVDTQELRAERYRAGGPASVLSQAVGDVERETLPERPKSLDDLAARYGAAPRARRYARGKKFLVTEAEFEPVEGADGEQRGGGETGGSAEGGGRSSRLYSTT